MGKNSDEETFKVKMKIPIAVAFLLHSTAYQMTLTEAGDGKCRVKYDLHQCLSPITSPEKSRCQNAVACRKNFHLTYINLQPYNSLLIKHLLNTCCGHCTNLSVNTFVKLDQINASSTNNTHFIFPVLGQSTRDRMYGYHFIPFIEAPSLIYITAKEDHLVENLILASLYMWPLLVICSMLVVVSGFIGWVIETWCNEEEFPRNFLLGWFEGTWWSFISMTTVGYGDKKPKSVPGRIFTMIWILIGITIFSLVTALLTSEIKQANSPPTPEMEGAKVAALRHRTYDASLIAKRGGILIDVFKRNDTYGILHMVQMLKNKDIDGFVLDRYAFIMFTTRYSKNNNETNKLLKEGIEYIQLNCIFTEKDNEGKLSYGILVKHKEDYEYLADFVLDNREIINTCNGLIINNFKGNLTLSNVANPLFSASGRIFWTTFAILTSIIGVMIIVGIVYELNRRNYLQRFNIGNGPVTV